MGKFFKYSQQLNVDAGAPIQSLNNYLIASNTTPENTPSSSTSIPKNTATSATNSGLTFKNIQKDMLADKTNLPPLILLRQRIAGPESGDRDTYADGSHIVSPKGATGRLQIMPGTAATYGHTDDDWKTNKDIQYEIYDKYMVDHMRMAKMDPNNLTPTHLNALAASWYGGSKAMFAYLKQSQQNEPITWLDKNQNITKKDGTVLKFPSINQYVNRIKFN